MTTDDESDEGIGGDSPAIPSSSFHAIDRATAMSLVDEHLGDADEWPSPLMNFRLSAVSQADWKEEIGQCLHIAEQHGYLSGKKGLVHRLTKQGKRRSRSLLVDPNDKRHEQFSQELAPAVVDYYLSGTGWSFHSWEPEVDDGDVDLIMVSPDGDQVNIQVKAPERLGIVSNGRVHDGENPDALRKALDKSCDQLAPSPGKHNVIALCSKRRFSLANDIRHVLSYLVGRTVQTGPGQIELRKQDRGVFFDEAWAHVSAVVAIDYVRAADLNFVRYYSYACTAVMNPRARNPASPTWFPGARVCVVRHGTIDWVRGEPGDGHGMPVGTVVLE